MAQCEPSLTGLGAALGLLVTRPEPKQTNEPMRDPMIFPNLKITGEIHF